MLNWLDRAIGFFSPSAEVRRLQARVISKHLAKRGYEGATRGRRGLNWTTANQSADAASATDLPILRARARDMVRNNPYAERGIRVIEANVVGTGIIPTANTRAAGRNEALEKLWIKWGDTTACDFDGTHDFYGLQRLIMKMVARDGGALVRRHFKKPDASKNVPLQLQVLEMDYLDTRKHGTFNGKNAIINGIETDPAGRVVAYWLYEVHPGAVVTFQSLRNAFTSHRVPASEILHVYRKDRAGQLYGVPWLAPVMLRMKDLDDYEDAQLLKQKISACAVGAIKDIEAPETSNLTDEEKEAWGRIEPGAWEFLPPGKDVEFFTPPTVQGYAEHTRSVLRAIAVGLGITYESLAGDYSQSNFSSSRMGWLEFNRNITVWRNEIMIPQFCAPAYTWFAIAANMAGLAQAVTPAIWTAPRREMIDPVKETEAIKAQIRMGTKSLSEAITEDGKDPAVVFQQYAADNKTIDELGLVFDSDPRQDAKKAPSPAPSQGEDGEDKDKEEGAE